MPLTLNLQSFTQSNLVSSAIKRISIGADGAVLSGESHDPVISADGRYLLFKSDASTLVPGDTNGKADIFRKDLVTGAVIRVSTAGDEAEANGVSYNYTISADGRYVLFTSEATNLTGDTTTGTVAQAFVKDLTTGAVTRVSENAAGDEINHGIDAPLLSNDGRYIVFTSWADNLVPGVGGEFFSNVFRKDLTTGVVELVSEAVDGTNPNSLSSVSSVSADGRYVFFESLASNLVAGDTNGTRDLFRKDMTTGAVDRISKAADGTQANGESYQAAYSADGRYVVFTSTATNLVAGDTNGKADIFRKDLKTGAVIRVTTAADGTQGNWESSEAQISADGRYVIFYSYASNLAPGEEPSTRPAFPITEDVYRKDLVTGAIVRLTPTINGSREGGPYNFDYSLAISPDGQKAYFGSVLSNLVAGDVNGKSDIFEVDVNLLSSSSSRGSSVNLMFDTGAASQVSLAWGDGTVDTITPVAGSASFNHTYAAQGAKDAVATVFENGKSWAVPYKIVVGSGPISRNTALADTLSGSAAADTLTGDNETNIILGNAGKDTLRSFVGHDTLSGGLGNDVLDGGAGKDVFVFDTKLNKRTNKDKILSWNTKDDTIRLDNDIFKKLKVGKLQSKFFTLGDKAKDANDYIGVNKVTGDVWYDPNGDKAGGQVIFANIGKKKAIFASDFEVI